MPYDCPYGVQDVIMRFAGPFAGFIRGTRATAVPDPMFGLLLEQIQDLAELKVVLRGLWLRNQKKGSLRPVSRQEFLNDPVLRRGLAGEEPTPQERILRGLDLAVQHGVFLRCLSIDGPDGPDGPPAPADGAVVHDRDVYLLNTDQDRQALAQRGWEVAAAVPAGAESASIGSGGLGEPAASGTGERPNIFALYEDNIGTIGPIMAETLKAAESQYPEAWITEAFGIGITQNKRSWAYIEAILRRWAAEGKDHGELGRHSPPDNYQKHLRDYQRRWGISENEGG